MMHLKTLTLCLAFASGTAFAAASDIDYPPSPTSGGHDFNHAPVGQTFVAKAANVKAGLYVNGSNATGYISTTLKLYAGATTTGTPLYSEVRTFTAPFADFMDVDYRAKGVVLVPGNTYTLLVTDNEPRAGVTGWVVPSLVDFNQVGSDGLSPGAYASGQPILQGQIVTNDRGIGDNAFHVIDLTPSSSTQPVTPPPVVKPPVTTPPPVTPPATSPDCKSSSSFSGLSKLSSSKKKSSDTCKTSGKNR